VTTNSDPAAVPSAERGRVTIETCDLPQQVTHVWAPEERILLVRADLSRVELHHAVRDAVEHLLAPAATGRTVEVETVRAVPTQPAPLSA
jgi:hypothetical protein